METTLLIALAAIIYFGGIYAVVKHEAKKEMRNNFPQMLAELPRRKIDWVNFATYLGIISFCIAEIYFFTTLF